MSSSSYTNGEELAGGVVPANRSVAESKPIQAGNGVWSTKVAWYVRSFFPDSKVSAGNSTSNGVEGSTVIVRGSVSFPALDKISEMFFFVVGAASSVTGNFSSMLATTPASPAAVIANVAVPVSLAFGVPKSVLFSASSDSQEGFPVNEYCKFSGSG
jgi:hypothetical protein